MIWKAAVILGVVLGAHGYAISEQKFIRHIKPVEHQGHHGELTHLGEHKPEHHHVYADAYPLYEYSYKVEDPHTHDFKGQEEKRDGDVTKGSYWLIQPDGFKRVVEYEVDGKSGFKANVHYLHPHEEHKHEEGRIREEREREEREREEREREEREREEREREEREREEREREEKEREEREREEREREERLREERIREEIKHHHYKHEPKIHIHHEVIKHKEEPKEVWEEKKEEEKGEEKKSEHWEHKAIYIPIVKYYKAPAKYEYEHRIPISKYEHDIHHEIPVLKHHEEIESEHNPHAPVLVVKEPIHVTEYRKPEEWKRWSHGQRRVYRKSTENQ